MSSTASDPARAETVLLIHGMWMTPLSWEHWATRYTGQGHNVIAPAWPGLEAEPEQLRRDPSPLRNLDIRDIIAHYEKIIGGLDRPPIIIGHSSAACSRSCCSIAASAPLASHWERVRPRASSGYRCPRFGPPGRPWASPRI